MGIARFWELHHPRIQRAGAALLRPRTAMALGAKTGNSRRAGRSIRPWHPARDAKRGDGRFACPRRSGFKMTAERPPWISVDPASRSLFELAQKVAAVPTTLLITGESGAGKDYLARVLQERAFERLGGTETLRIEARLVALTNVDLPAAVTAGRFREDLFFRMNVLTIAMPPLRERRADILPLADHFLAALSLVHARSGVQLSEASRRMLAAYNWPGNVRELRNALERAVVFNRVEVLEPEHFAENIRAAAAGTSGMTAGLRSLEDVEKEVIAATLEGTRYKITQAATILGISRKTLLEKRKKYGLK